MKIDCISDLHGFYPMLKGGDLLIVAGDLTARDEFKEYENFRDWLFEQKYKNKIVVGGNHDKALQENRIDFSSHWLGASYLFDSGCRVPYLNPLTNQLDFLKVWGSPWTAKFGNVNPKCTAFMLSNDAKLSKKWDKIPNDTNILVTHSPPLGYGDRIILISDGGKTHEVWDAGSSSLLNRIRSLPHLKLHVFGHIHEGYGSHTASFDNLSRNVKIVNCSIVNENYQPINKQIRVEL